MNQPLVNEKVTLWMRIRTRWLELCGWPESCIDHMVLDGEKKSQHKKKGCPCVAEREQLIASLKKLFKDGEL